MWWNHVRAETNLDRKSQKTLPQGSDGWTLRRDQQGKLWEGCVTDQPVGTAPSGNGLDRDGDAVRYIAGARRSGAFRSARIDFYCTIGTKGNHWIALDRKITRWGFLFRKTTSVWVGGGKNNCRETQQKAKVVDLSREDGDFYRDGIIELEKGKFLSKFRQRDW